MGVEKRDGQLCVVDHTIKMKYSLIDFMLIDGVHIDRRKNRSAESYDITDNKNHIIFKPKGKAQDKHKAKTDFKEIFENRQVVESQDLYGTELEQEMRKTLYQGHKKGKLAGASSVISEEELSEQILESLKKEITEPTHKDPQIMRLDLQISTNLRMCIGFSDRLEDPRYVIGAPK